MKQYKQNGKQETWKNRIIEYLDKKPPRNGYYGYLKEEWYKIKKSTDMKYSQFLKEFGPKWSKFNENEKKVCYIIYSI